MGGTAARDAVTGTGTPAGAAQPLAPAGETPPPRRQPPTETAAGAARRLAILVGGVVLLTLLGSCAAGYLIVNYGGGDRLREARDVAVWILALFFLLVVLLVGALYFVLAWALGYYGRRLPPVLHTAGTYVARIEGVTERVAEEYVVRPLGRAAALTSEGRAFIHALTEGAAAATAPARRWRHRLRAGGRPMALPEQAPPEQAPPEGGGPEGGGPADRAGGRGPSPGPSQGAED